MQWKLDDLLDDADAFEVAEHIGIPISKKGSSKYIPCVSGSHSETKYNHNQLFNNGCHCYSCGAYYGIYDIVRYYHQNVLGVTLTHNEICTVIAETCGGVERYTEDKKKKTKKFPLSKEFLILIGLKPSSPKAKAIVAFSTEKTEECNKYEPSSDGYIKEKDLDTPSMFTLFKEEEDVFWELVRNKFNETLERIYEDIKVYSDPKYKDNETAKLWLKEAKEKYKTLLLMRKTIVNKKVVSR